eukprot:Nitzschia sp. Nitz4//scaffold122_size67431//44574//45758//NITZ4_006089-RA/size67431-processed-gene-0.44-mRNA-1//-1//CDS//3329534415//2639//frame0
MKTSFLLGTCFVVCTALSLLVGFVLNSDDSAKLPMPLMLTTWSIAQWAPSSLRQRLLSPSWYAFERNSDLEIQTPISDIPTIDMTGQSNPLEYLEKTFGKDWKERPLLLRRLWSDSELQNPNRRLSLEGLLSEELEVPFFQDSRVYGALTPDNEAPLKDIVSGIQSGLPYKVGTQKLIQTYPDLLREVAPLDTVTKMFGDSFSVDRLLGHTNLMGMIKGPLTVPVFVAYSGSPASQELGMVKNGNETVRETNEESAEEPMKSSNPVTGLHCEPIANVAVQVYGSRRWTLVDPKYSSLLRPMSSPDGRGFFASAAESFAHVPRYEFQTLPGDAVWVPTWTWHRIDYVSDPRCDSPVSIGASLFHFRPMDFFRRNPLYAVLLLPSLVGEMLGTRTQ